MTHQLLSVSAPQLGLVRDAARLNHDQPLSVALGALSMSDIERSGNEVNLSDFASTEFLHSDLEGSSTLPPKMRNAESDDLALERAISEMQHEIDGVAVRTRSLNGMTFQSCFVGSELVDWLIINGYSRSRYDAALFARELYRLGVLRSVIGRDTFEDIDKLYRFTSATTRAYSSLNRANSLADVDEFQTRIGEFENADAPSVSSKLNHPNVNSNDPNTIADERNSLPFSPKRMADRGSINDDSGDDINIDGRSNSDRMLSADQSFATPDNQSTNASGGARSKLSFCHPTSAHWWTLRTVLAIIQAAWIAFIVSNPVFKWLIVLESLGTVIGVVNLIVQLWVLVQFYSIGGVLNRWELAMMSIEAVVQLVIVAGWVMLLVLTPLRFNDATFESLLLAVIAAGVGIQCLIRAAENDRVRAAFRVLHSVVAQCFGIALLISVCFYTYAMLGTLLFSPLAPWNSSVLSSAQREALGHAFGSVPRTLGTLFQVMVFDEVGSVFQVVTSRYYLGWTLVVSFSIVVSFLLLNLILATIIDGFNETERVVLQRSEKHLASLNKMLTQTIEKQYTEQRKLRKLREFLGHTVDALPAGVYVIDADCRVVLLNKFMCKWFGISKHEAIGKTVFDVYSFDDALTVHNDDIQVLKSGVALTTRSHEPNALGEMIDVQRIRMSFSTSNGSRFLVCFFEIDSPAQQRYYARES